MFIKITWAIRRQSLSGLFFFIIYYFFLSIIDKKINIKNKPEQLCYVCQHNLPNHFVSKININLNKKWMPVSCINCLYNNNKFKKDIWRQNKLFISLRFTLLKGVKWLNWNVVNWWCHYLKNEHCESLYCGTLLTCD